MKINLNEMYNEKCSDVALTTIFSLSRCIKGFPFPNVIKNEATANRIIEIVNEQFESFEQGCDYKKISIETIDILTRKILEETNIIPQNFNEKIQKEIIMKIDNSVAILVNFNNHLTIKALSNGFQIKDLTDRIFMIEEFFSSNIQFLFDKNIGYIIDDLYYLGTGLNMSLLLSIPGIVMMGRLLSVIETLKKDGIAINGYYTNNSHSSMGWIYYIYNDSSVGKGEKEEVLIFGGAMLKLIYLEREMRLQLYLKNKVKIIDMIAKALAIAKSAKLLETDEALDIAFKIKLGLDLNKIVNVTHEQCNANFYNIQVAHIAYSLINSEFKGLNDEIIKMERANIINKFAKNIAII